MENPLILLDDFPFDYPFEEDLPIAMFDYRRLFICSGHGLLLKTSELLDLLVEAICKQTGFGGSLTDVGYLEDRSPYLILT